MRTIPIITAAALAACALTTQPADAGGPPCKEARELAELLAREYAEAPTGYGIDNGGNLLSVYAGEKSWTVVKTSPLTGVSCIVAAGKGGWHAIEALKGEAS